MKRIIARWFFMFATVNIYIASLIEEKETAALLVFLYKDVIEGAKKALAKSGSQ
jgi:hypothetical protein